MAINLTSKDKEILAKFSSKLVKLCLASFFWSQASIYIFQQHLGLFTACIIDICVFSALMCIQDLTHDEDDLIKHTSFEGTSFQKLLNKRMLFAIFTEYCLGKTASFCIWYLVNYGHTNWSPLVYFYLFHTIYHNGEFFFVITCHFNQLNYDSNYLLTIKNRFSHISFESVYDSTFFVCS